MSIISSPSSPLRVSSEPRRFCAPPAGTSPSPEPVDGRAPLQVQPLDPPVQRERLTQLFLRLTQIPGASYNERQIADAIKAEVTDIGFEGATIKEDQAGQAIGGNTGNVIVDIPGNVEGAPAIIFSSHMDTVPLAVGCHPTLGDDGIIRTDGKTALGGDNRAGCSEILEAVREIKEGNLPHGPLQLVFCVGEEEGLLGSEELKAGQLHGKYAFVMDVFKANEMYLQYGHVLEAPEQSTRDTVDRAHRQTEQLPPANPDDSDLSPKEKEIVDFTSRAMQRVGLQPAFYDLEWGGTDAISMRQLGINAISLGAGEEGEHTRKEQMAVDDLVASTTLVRGIVEQAAQSAAPPVPAPPTRA